MSKKYCTIPASQVISRFSRERRARIAADAQEIIAEQTALSHKAYALKGFARAERVRAKK